MLVSCVATSWALASFFEEVELFNVVHISCLQYTQVV